MKIEKKLVQIGVPVEIHAVLREQATEQCLSLTNHCMLILIRHARRSQEPIVQEPEPIDSAEGRVWDMYESMSRFRDELDAILERREETIGELEDTSDTMVTYYRKFKALEESTNG